METPNFIISASCNTRETLICAFFIILMIRQREGELSKIMLCIGILSGVQNAGYLQEMVSKSLEEVMMAVRIVSVCARWNRSGLLLDI